MIEMNNVVKKYPNGVVAANGITVHIKKVNLCILLARVEQVNRHLLS